MTTTSRRADAALIRGMAHRVVMTDKIMAVQEAAGWRLVWATPEASEHGIFLFRKVGTKTRLVDIWGGVAQPSERGDLVGWARRRGMPDALAECFASKVVRDGP